jgi:hypothetical protein
MIQETESASPDDGHLWTAEELSQLASMVRKAEDAAEKSADKLAVARTRMRRSFHAWEKAHARTGKLLAKLTAARQEYEAAKTNRKAQARGAKANGR